ncbi:MAG: MBL fold metallo-hydrolase, partial [Planctomycetota bacterium]|nr:MBL fold metallo-hydrolase [Planctomycetota bacterium]
MESITTVPALGDNLIYLHRYNQSDCLVVDPGECASVLRILEEEALSLKMILVTHHHWDHTGGIGELK